jgi:hypothetical protein
MNEEGKESTAGKATVALPYHGSKPVPCPFIAPLREARLQSLRHTGEAHG